MDKDDVEERDENIPETEGRADADKENHAGRKGKGKARDVQAEQGRNERPMEIQEEEGWDESEMLEARGQSLRQAMADRLRTQQGEYYGSQTRGREFVHSGRPRQAHPEAIARARRDEAGPSGSNRRGADARVAHEFETNEWDIPTMAPNRNYDRSMRAGQPGRSQNRTQLEYRAHSENRAQSEYRPMPNTRAAAYLAHEGPGISQYEDRAGSVQTTTLASAERRGHAQINRNQWEQDGTSERIQQYQRPLEADNTYNSENDRESLRTDRDMNLRFQDQRNYEDEYDYGNYDDRMDEEEDGEIIPTILETQPQHEDEPMDVPEGGFPRGSDPSRRPRVRDQRDGHGMGPGGVERPPEHGRPRKYLQLQIL